MMISWHFLGFWKNKKNWSFRSPCTCRKMRFFYFSQFCIFCSQMSELLRFRCSDVILCGFPAILRAFEEIKKNWSFRWPWTCRKMWFFYFSHVCRFCRQMNEFWSFRWPCSCRKMRFLDISKFCRFCSRMNELLHFSSYYVTFDVIFWWFPAILRAFEKIKIKNWSFQWPQTCRKTWFWTHHVFADFAAKLVNYYILGVLMSYYDDFLPF